MTMLWSPDRYGRSAAPRVSILQGRGGLREEHWRNLRRRIDPQDTTPFAGPEVDESVIEELARWYRETWWSGWALGAALVLIGTLLGLSIAFGWTWDGAVDAAARVRS
jgi:anti-sigma factor RsiW